MMTRKRLLGMLDSYSNTSLIREYLRSLIELEITPFEDEASLKEVDLNYVTREILRYNLIINSIEAVTYDYNPRNSDLIINKGFDFNIDLRKNKLSKTYNLININFDGDIKLIINNRSNIRKLILEKQKEKEELEKYYYNNFYIYFGSLDSEEDKKEMRRIEERISLLDSEICELEKLEEIDDLEYLDNNIYQKLKIKEKNDEIVSSDDLYDIRKINDYGKVKVYKKQIKK